MLTIFSGAAAPVGRHLPSAAGRICARSHSLEKHVGRRYPKCESQCAVAIVREEPVVSRLQGQAGTHLQRLMPCGRDLKEGLLLLLEQRSRGRRCGGTDTSADRSGSALVSSGRPEASASSAHERWKPQVPFVSLRGSGSFGFRALYISIQRDCSNRYCSTWTTRVSMIGDFNSGPPPND